MHVFIGLAICYMQPKLCCLTNTKPLWCGIVFSNRFNANAMKNSDSVIVLCYPTALNSSNAWAACNIGHFQDGVSNNVATVHVNSLQWAATQTVRWQFPPQEWYFIDHGKLQQLNKRPARLHFHSTQPYHVHMVPETILHEGCGYEMLEKGEMINFIDGEDICVAGSVSDWPVSRQHYHR